MSTRKDSFSANMAGALGAAVMASSSRTAAIQQQHLLQQQLPPSLFDVFYEELLTSLVKSGDLDETVPKEFMQLQTDIDRIEYLLGLRPIVNDLEIKTKIGLKSSDMSNKYREEGNKLFQADQTPQAILFYNKSLVFAPHPNYDDYTWPPELESDGKDGKKDSKSSDKKQQPSKYESLALCYANRSAALRKLCQYEDCLRDIARAARFGYPKENMFKLWERKAKCYQGIKRYDMAAKCLRQAIQVLKDASLTENQKTSKTNEYQSMLKEMSNAQIIMQMGSSPVTEADEDPSSYAPVMAATGPMVFVPEPPSKKKSTVVPASPVPPAPPPPVGDKAAVPPRPERKSVFGRKSTPVPPAENGSDKPQLKIIGGSYCSMSKPASSTPINIPQQQNPSSATAAGSSVGSATGCELRKATSQISITQLSGINVSIRPDNEVPELSYGINPRMPSASVAIDLRFSPDKGRFFVATQDLSPGDVILREEPYAAVLESIFRVNHCSHCLRKTSTPIPCFECATVQYCCETCRDAGWNEYHRIECGVLAYLEPSRFLGKMPHLALRIITRTGMQNLVQHSMATLNPTAKNGSKAETANSHPGFTQNRSALGESTSMFDPTSYRSVHNLATNTDKRPFEDLIKKTAEAIFMAKCLKFTGFFGDRDENTRKAEIFIASLLLRHLQIAATNGLEMAECILKNNDITKFDIIPVGGAIFPTMSFFNHSCYPNALRLGYQSYQVVRAIRTIRRGEEVNIDYGFDFYANPIEIRQKRANSQYHFMCRCIACVDNWPTYNELAGHQRALKVTATHNIVEEINRQTANYQIGMDYLVKLDIANAMPIFRDYLITMNELVEHPDQYYIDCEEAYKQCLWLENRGFKPKTSDLHANAHGKTLMSAPAVGVFAR